MSISATQTDFAMTEHNLPENAAETTSTNTVRHTNGIQKALCSIRFLTALLCAVFIIVTAICLLVTTFSFSISAAQDIAESHAVALATKAKGDVEDLLNKPLASVSSWQYSYSQGSRPLPKDSPITNWHEEYWRQFAEAMKGTDFSYQFAVFGFDDGNYAGCKNLVGEKFQCRLFSRPQNLTGYGTVGLSGLLEYTYFRSNYSVSKINAATINYDPRTRSWYNMVDHIPKAMKWSSVYLSAIPTLPIIDVNAAMYNATGALLGVISMTFELGLLSNFLSELVTTTNTVSMLIDNEDLLLASSYSDPYLTSVDIPKPYTGTVPSNCLVSDSANDATLSIMLCRAHISTYSYTPLRELTSKRSTLVKNGQSGALRIKLDSMDYFVSVVPVETAEAEGMHWRFALFVPQNDIVGGIVRGRDIAIYISIAIVVVAVGLCFVILTLLLRPLGELRDQVSKVASLETQPTHGKGQGQVSRSIISEINSLQKHFQQMAKAVLSFGKYVPQDVVRELMATGAVAESKMVEGRLTVLFSDIQGFTTLCEKLNNPTKVSKLLTLFFSSTTRRLLAHGATIDKFIGDCIMCFWGAPLRVDNPNFRALCAGLDLLQTARELDRAFQRHKVRLSIRVGAHCGKAMVGNIGSDERINYTVMGDIVNTASRLEGANKAYGSSFLASEEVLMGSKRSGMFAYRFVGSLTLRGKSKKTTAFHVCGTRYDHMDLDQAEELRMTEPGSPTAGLGEGVITVDPQGSINSKPSTNTKIVKANQESSSSNRSPHTSNSAGNLSKVRDFLPISDCYNSISSHAYIRPKLSALCTRLGTLIQSRLKPTDGTEANPSFLVSEFRPEIFEQIADVERYYALGTRKSRGDSDAFADILGAEAHSPLEPEAPQGTTTATTTYVALADGQNIAPPEKVDDEEPAPVVEKVVPLVMPSLLTAPTFAEALSIAAAASAAGATSEHSNSLIKLAGLTASENDAVSSIIMQLYSTKN
eukprot:GILI01005327.1.p1 GENE.GILI01005327.1~~GILI01005327.1.p1  ORF type:complete len:984 (+),score=201.25 GILI01005327.1:146-3097(+)